jgi:hypothetical protein
MNQSVPSPRAACPPRRTCCASRTAPPRAGRPRQTHELLRPSLPAIGAEVPRPHPAAPRAPLPLWNPPHRRDHHEHPQVERDDHANQPSGVFHGVDSLRPQVLESTGVRCRVPFRCEVYICRGFPQTGLDRQPSRPRPPAQPLPFSRQQAIPKWHTPCGT